MYIRRKIRFQYIWNDSWKFLLGMACWSILVVYLYEFLGYKQIDIPILPVTTIGVAVALYLGFKSTQAYARWWEARMIWGAIVNDSRSWANFVTGLVYQKEEIPDKAVHRELIYHHLAWVNAMVYQLRKTSRLNESDSTHIFDYRKRRNNQEDPHFSTDCYAGFLSRETFKTIQTYNNPAVQILGNQSIKLQCLAEKGLLDSYRHVAMMNLLSRFNDAQGKCERIKNTPFPRQIAHFGTIFTKIFIILIPLAFLDAFGSEADRLHLTSLLHHEYMVSLVPFAMLIGWIFFMIEKISDSGEDPFEGGANDVPISALSRIIEIDLRQCLDDEDIPGPVKPLNDVLY
ncbi:MAG: hypothetical protein GY746_16610 [Gammaproteobacteria bacterium]|nr:hypothetical protein [Gammaproteobacteria bacterium]